MIGEIISHYKVLERLGQGGMGIVYKAEDSRLKRTVALKFLPPDLSHNPEAGERFLREARAASALDHPNICTVYEVGQGEDGQLFISMAYYDGMNLKEKIAQGRLRSRRPLPSPCTWLADSLKLTLTGCCTVISNLPISL